MIRRAIPLFLGVIFIGAVGLILWMRYGEFWKVDACLDSGGAWDYSAKECRH
ncbi:MAG TPA: hypothetical protein VFK19_10435 [Sphingomicrobium sp.]|nr:hypothetical protein [Sphingomicrobium sp.]